MGRAGRTAMIELEDLLRMLTELQRQRLLDEVPETSEDAEAPVSLPQSPSDQA